MSSSLSPYRILVFVGLLCVICFAVLLMLHRCVCNSRRRRRRRQGQQGQEVEETSYSVDMSSSSRVHLVKGAAPLEVVCPYRKSEAWTESTCPVCLAEFADGEAVRVLPECMHYFHAECIDTWLRGSTSCPMCRAETTPTPSPGELHHSLSVSLEEILVRT